MFAQSWKLSDFQYLKCGTLIANLTYCPLNFLLFDVFLFIFLELPHLIIYKQDRHFFYVSRQRKNLLHWYIIHENELCYFLYARQIYEIDGFSCLQTLSSFGRVIKSNLIVRLSIDSLSLLELFWGRHVWVKISSFSTRFCLFYVAVRVFSWRLPPC